ncbi:MAG: alpha-E domain-containing protein [Microscillaceae bacterium]|jgi:uncharacterized alpha-E superfamily protein|nr:alpha-E domain-containing protein [Microscillaceae bacterium]
MLARVANCLYWMGRYVERTEHLARYLNVQYFSTLDAPMSQNKDFVLRSIMNMAGIQYELDEPIIEEDVLVKVAFDTENSASIIAAVNAGRENARSIRSVISSELWESINKYYLFMQNYPIDVFKTQGLYDFCMQVIQHCAIIKSTVNSTLIHDDVYSCIMLGIHLERANQVTRILSNKLYDIEFLTLGEENHPIENYQYTITLKVLQAFDMSHRYYKAPPTRQSTCEFLIGNKYFTRSIGYNMEQVKEILKSLSQKKIVVQDSLEFKIGKLANYFKYVEYHEIADDLQGFLHRALDEIYKLHTLLEKEYMQI